MARLSRSNFATMSFEELLNLAHAKLENVHSEYDLKDLAKQFIDKENVYMALHILEALYQAECNSNGYSKNYFVYDVAYDGATNYPRYIRDKKDLEELFFGKSAGFLSNVELN